MRAIDLWPFGRLPSLTRLRKIGRCLLRKSNFRRSKVSKNDNEVGKPAKVWRYAHFDSQATFESKRAVLVATLKKLDKMASNEQELVHSAMQKLNEFIQLKYPKKLIWTACTTLAVVTRDIAWFKIRGAILKWF